MVGCVDGTQIKIKAPNVNEGEYVNRKGFHSLNVQVIFFPTKWTIKIKIIYTQCIIKLKDIGAMCGSRKKNIPGGWVNPNPLVLCMCAFAIEFFRHLDFYS